MNPEAILALLGELYANLHAARQEIAQLQGQLAEATEQSAADTAPEAPPAT